MLRLFFMIAINYSSQGKTLLLVPVVTPKYSRNIMKNAFICSICEGFIFDGETMWSVNVHHETSENWVTTVLDAKSAYIFCEDCARQLDFDNILIPSKMKGSKNAKYK